METIRRQLKSKATATSSPNSISVTSDAYLLSRSDAENKNREQNNQVNVRTTQNSKLVQQTQGVMRTSRALGEKIEQFKGHQDNDCE